MHDHIKAWLRVRLNRRAVTSLEYAFIAALVAVVALVGFASLMTNLKTKVTAVAVKLT